MNAEELKNSYKQTNYQLGNHGFRTLDVLNKGVAGIDSDMESDMYGTGEVIETFEAKMAHILGKESAVFFPSGTMAQQIALRVWTDQQKNKRIAYHPLSYLELHEEDGLRNLHQVEPVLVGVETRLITLKDIEGLREPIACLLLELPQREIGGQLPSFEELRQLAHYCRERGIILHLDGARLWECLPYYEKTAAEICQLFDSVYVSFYKGLGGIAGAILAGKQSFTKEAKIWKRRYGGDLISLYPYILPADYYYNLRISKMPEYYRAAQQLAEYFNQCTGVQTLPKIPVTNMFHVYFSRSVEAIAPIITAIQTETGLGLTGMLKKQNDDTCSFELSIGDAYHRIPAEKIAQLFKKLEIELGTTC